MKRELPHHRKVLENRFYGLTRKPAMKIDFDTAEINGVSERFNRGKKKWRGKDWLKEVSKRAFRSVSRNNPVSFTSQGELSTEVTNCPAYEESYGDDWIQCGTGKDWWHEDCSNYEDFGPFACDCV
ncbi:hypothetical protein PR048_021161 [Dryococelus australis]|uniref:Uncharacterized protein n=1 Tax=Dryococelus australis TaxID=614101 RepID=A0ABQ9GXE8_9NEOP|nr:hypothetical protein PR048_021161 [Dryococelus australis]